MGITGLGEFLGYFDYWAHRYQGLLAALVALTIAFQQLRISRSQSAISKEQHQMTKRQLETDRAIAVIEIDKFLIPSKLPLDDCIARAMHLVVGGLKNPEDWYWDNSALEKFDGIEIPGNLPALAAKAYPDEAAMLVHLSIAVKDVQDLSAEFKTNPWMFQTDGDLPERDVRQSRKTNSALNRVWKYMQANYSILPWERAKFAANQKA